MTKDPIKITVALGFAGVLTLMGLISIISLSQMNALIDQTSTLLEETKTRISAANTMRHSIQLRGNTLQKMYLTDDYIERDEYRLEFAEQALQYNIARKVMYTFSMSARESKLLDQLMKQTRFSKGLNDAAAENMLSDLPYEVVKDSLQIANVARHDTLIGLDKLVLLSEEITSSVIENYKQQQESISNLILLLSLAAFLIAVYIAQLVVRETTRKNAEIQFQATHDELTKLVNRKEFNQRLSNAFSTAKNHQETHVLCFLDLDRFKMVNDSCGHKAGDELLIQLTTIIASHIRHHDTLARIGGDEFGLLLENCSLDNAIEIAEGIISLVKNYEFNWHEKTFHVGVSIGVSSITHRTKSVEAALSQADIACYNAKDLGRSQVQIHGQIDERIERIHKELSWVADINNAESVNHFELHLQAINNIQSDQKPSMYEVLLRLNDDEGTLVPPGSYLSTAERFSLMKGVDRWVIEQSFKHLAELYKIFPHCEVKFFINISANSLNNNEFAEFVIKQYRKYNIAHDAICLEVAEIKALKNIPQVADIVATLRKNNIKFALDNYGAEAPSFSSLKSLPVDYLKIDGSIIKNMHHNTVDKAMVAAINQIGKVMNIGIIAKHVENAFILNQLKEIGVEYAQGFYLDKPAIISDRIKSIKLEAVPKSQRH